MVVLGGDYRGKVLSSGQEIEGVGNLACPIELEDGSIAYLPHEDIIWGFSNPDDPEAISEMSLLAQSLVGRDINVIVIGGEPIIVGRKQTYGDPFLKLMDMNAEVLLEGEISEIGDDFMKCRISCRQMNGDELGFVEGLLDKKLLAHKILHEIKEGTTLSLKIVRLEPDERIVFVAPATDLA